MNDRQRAMDPTTSQDDLEFLAPSYPCEVAMNPNTSLSVLTNPVILRAALFWAEQNPALALIYLEDPVLYVAAKKEFDSAWLRSLHKAGVLPSTRSRFKALFLAHRQDLLSDTALGLGKDMITTLRRHASGQLDNAQFNLKMADLHNAWARISDASEEQPWQQRVDAYILSGSYAGLPITAASQIRAAMIIMNQPEAAKEEYDWQVNTVRELCAQEPLLRDELGVG